MQTKLIASALIAALALTACSKPPEEAPWLLHKLPKLLLTHKLLQTLHLQIQLHKLLLTLLHKLLTLQTKLLLTQLLKKLSVTL